MMFLFKDAAAYLFILPYASLETFQENLYLYLCEADLKSWNMVALRSLEYLSEVSTAVRSEYTLTEKALRS